MYAGDADARMITGYARVLMREYSCESTRSVSVSDRNTTISSTSIGEINAITCSANCVACRVLHVACFMLHIVGWTCTSAQQRRTLLTFQSNQCLQSTADGQQSHSSGTAECRG
jgi:hypothetical protein